MSLMTKKQLAKGGDQVRVRAVKARRQARQAATRVAPLAASAKVTARRGVHGMRSWAAPKLEQSGQALQKRVAPRMSAMLSSAARRVEPERRKPRRWPVLIAGMAAAAAAAAAAIVKRGSPARWRSAKPGPEEPAADGKAQAAGGTGTKDEKVRTS